MFAVMNKLYKINGKRAHANIIKTNQQQQPQQQK